MSTDYYFPQKIPNAALDFRMVQVPGGNFQMGSQEGNPDAWQEEMPQHPVRLKDFWIAEHPVTQALWEAVMGNNPSNFKGAQRPVEQVSWFDAVVFCNALSQKIGRKPAYLTPNGQSYGLDGSQWTLPNKGEVLVDTEATGYRLATEAEWEFAAKGGAGADYPYQYAGSDLLDQVGWYSENSGGETQEVGLLLPNALGLYDMSGNVWEWCEDWYADYEPKEAKNPRGPEQGVDRVFRGGGWGAHSRYCRPASRDHGRPVHRDHALGFRLALQSVG